jgi:hypothetical protein
MVQLISPTSVKTALLPYTEVFEQGVQDIFDADIARNTSDSLCRISKLFRSKNYVIQC